jgi:hypothetical protein
MRGGRADHQAVGALPNDDAVSHVTANLLTRMEYVLNENASTLKSNVGDDMNMRRNSDELGDKTPKQKKSGLLRRFLRLFVRIFSSPKGDQGGWEGGARGL